MSVNDDRPEWVRRLEEEHGLPINQIPGTVYACCYDPPVVVHSVSMDYAGNPQLDEAWMQMVSEEGYRLLFGLDDEPGDDDPSPGPQVASFDPQRSQARAFRRIADHGDMPAPFAIVGPFPTCKQTGPCAWMTRIVHHPAMLSKGSRCLHRLAARRHDVEHPVSSLLDFTAPRRTHPARHWPPPQPPNNTSVPFVRTGVRYEWSGSLGGEGSFDLSDRHARYASAAREAGIPSS